MAAVTITIQAQSAEEARRHIAGLLAALDGEQPNAVAPISAEAPAPAETPAEEPAVSEPDSITPSEGEVPAKVEAIELETVRAKLSALVQAGHKDAVQALFSQFGASKLSEVPEDKYAELLAAAENIG